MSGGTDDTVVLASPRATLCAYWRQPTRGGVFAVHCHVCCYAGHNFGSFHDCCTTCRLDRTCADCTEEQLKTGVQPPCPGTVADVEDANGAIKKYSFANRTSEAPYNTCVPSDHANKGGNLMYPKVAADDGSSNADSISKCSTLQIDFTIGSKGSCLEKPNPCKNGGACCSGASLKGKGVTCGAIDATNACLGVPVCDGIHAECPRGAAKPDKTVCFKDSGSTWGECIGGACLKMGQATCSQADSLGPCYTEGYECVRTCMDIGSSKCIALGGKHSGGSCRAIGELVGLTFNFSTCEQIQAGHACVTKQQPGTCQADGSCKMNDSCGLGGMCCNSAGSFVYCCHACFAGCSFLHHLGFPYSPQQHCPLSAAYMTMQCHGSLAI